MKRVIVTGANGFLGQSLLKQLKQDGFEVVAFLLNGEKDDLAKSLGFSSAFGDVRDKESFAKIINPGDIVIHLAGIISIDKKNQDLVYDVNYRGTENALKASIEKKASQFIYVSSVHSIPPKKDITRESDFDFDYVGRDPYEQSKVKATSLVLKTDQSLIKTAVVFPSGILGPGDPKKGELSTLVNKIIDGKFGLYVSGGYEFVDVRDVALTLAKIAQKEATGSYIVSGGYLSIKQIAEIVSKTAGKTYKGSKVPRALAYLGLPFISLSHLFSKGKPLYTFYSLKVTGTKASFDCEKVKTELGVYPRSPEISLIDMTKEQLSKRLA